MDETRDETRPERCQRCPRQIMPEDGYWIVRRKELPEEYICEACSQDTQMAEYACTGRLSTRLMCDASLCKVRIEAGPNSLMRLRESVTDYYRRHLPALRRASDAVESLTALARTFEEGCWLGRLQTYYRNSPARGHHGQGDGWEAMLWGSAGRVLLTLQGLPIPGEEPPSITLIFDETSPTARGGIQGIDATREQAEWLLRSATEGMPELSPHESVTVAGL